MKVVCIDSNPNYLTKRLVEGETYTVIGLSEITKGYILSEVDHPDYPLVGFRPSRFIPLSNIDETEFERNYNKELV